MHAVIDVVVHAPHAGAFIQSRPEGCETQVDGRRLRPFREERQHSAMERPSERRSIVMPDETTGALDAPAEADHMT